MNKENKKKHYLIYQTTNLVNNKIYIGKHITENIEDNYFGSGKYLRNAINKYGLENFQFKILFELQNEEEMNLLEKCVVNKDFLKRKDVYNINVGGDGGWYHLADDPKYHGNNAWTKNKTIDEIKQQYDNLSKFMKNKFENMSEDEYKEFCNIMKLQAIQWHKEHPGYFAGKNNPMHGHVYTDETRKKLSVNQLGSKNSQYGTMWICNDLTKENRKIKKTDPISEGWRKGRICKKK